MRKLLLIDELAATVRLHPIIANTRISLDIETFYYDDIFHRYDEQMVREQLDLLCGAIRPDAIIFKPLSKTLAVGHQRLEISGELLRTLATRHCAKLYIHEPPDDALQYWMARADLVGKRIVPPDYCSRRGIITTHADVSPEYYCTHADRDIDVFICGPNSCAGPRRETVDYLLSCGMNIAVREYCLPESDHAGFLNRAKICVNLQSDNLSMDPIAMDDRDECQRAAFEAMTCGSLLIQDSRINMPKGMVGGVDFLSFTTHEELISLIDTHLKSDELRLRIARSGRYKAVHEYSARSLWMKVSENLGFTPLWFGRFRFFIFHHVRRLRYFQKIRKSFEVCKLQRLSSVVIWGGSQTGDKCLSYLSERNVSVHAFIDNSPERQGKYLRGLPILSLKNMGRISEHIDGVVLAFRGDKRTARYQLSQAGISALVIDYEYLELVTEKK